jgi:hypothetical protein
VDGQETTVRLTGPDARLFLKRFGNFEDGVITGLQLHLPRKLVASRKAIIDIQAMDRLVGGEWRIVRISISGVFEYQFRASREFSYSILSDGVGLDCAGDRCVLDLDPGPDVWSPDVVYGNGEYGKQYVIGNYCDYEVLEGPFI